MSKENLAQANQGDNQKLFNERLEELKLKIKYFIDNFPDKEVTIEKLYFDSI